MDGFETTCGSCGQKLKVDVDSSRGEISCPICRAILNLTNLSEHTKILSSFESNKEILSLIDSFRLHRPDCARSALDQLLSWGDDAVDYLLNSVTDSALVPISSRALFYIGTLKHVWTARTIFWLFLKQNRPFQDDVLRQFVTLCLMNKVTHCEVKHIERLIAGTCGLDSFRWVLRQVQLRAETEGDNWDRVYGPPFLEQLKCRLQYRIALHHPMAEMLHEVNTPMLVRLDSERIALWDNMEYSDFGLGDSFKALSEMGHFSSLRAIESALRELTDHGYGPAGDTLGDLGL